MNKNSLRVVIIISPDIQDKFVVSQLLDQFNIVGIFIEPQYQGTKTAHKKIKKIHNVLLKNRLNPISVTKSYFDRRYYEKYMQRANNIFHDSFYEKGKLIDQFSGCPVYHTGVREMSSGENVELLKKLKPDVLVLCGCSILRKNVLDVPMSGSINLHSGLAPYYRGCSCYFWPLYNNEPEYVGVTVHYVNPGIDDGDIIHHGRPVFEETDDELTLFVKLMNIGSDLMLKTVKEIQDGTVTSHKQTEEGRLYLDNATTVQHFRELHNRIKSGLIKNYLMKLKSNQVVHPKLVL